jgi:hypothetical protein
MPPPDTSRSAAPADRLADLLFEALRAVRRAAPADDQRVYLYGIDFGGRFTTPFVIVAAAFLAAVAPAEGPCKVFVYGSAVMTEVTAGRDQPGLVPLVQEGDLTRPAPALLANIVMCRVAREDAPPVEFALPPAALAALLNAAEVRSRLPRVELYARRPVYSPAYTLLGPGYHPAERVLVHGPAVEPDISPLPTGDTAFARLPRHLRTLLSGFCFATTADLANAVGLLVSGLLVNRFAEKGKPVALVDGNQPGVGKSLLLLVVGMILDGRLPQVIHYTAAEEELQKRICATLRSGEQSVVLVDNAKDDNGSAVSSPTLEANSVAPEISLRVLGTSTNFVRPNDVLWAITMNCTRVSPDLVSRGLPIQLQYDGRPEGRTFAGPHPLDYTREHRLAILGELAGMVERWTAAGRPDGTRGHRLTEWARVLGGVMAVNGLYDFLGNYEEAAADFDAGQDDLVALFEAAVGEPNGPVVFTNFLGEEER